MDCFYIGRLSGTKGTVWQYSATDVFSAYTWAELRVTPKNPSARWTSALARPINLSSGRSVQAYVDPGRAGTNQVHFTFFDAKGAELPIGDGVLMKATGSGGEPVTLTVTRYGQGHFIGEGTLTAGQWRVERRLAAGLSRKRRRG
jgi:hypothetical protein